MTEWRMRYGYGALALLPGCLPWRLAPLLGRDGKRGNAATEAFLVARFQQVFPQASDVQRHAWARAHLDMLSLEMMDGMALHRLGSPNGPTIELSGWEHAQVLLDRGKGFIMVLNHFDRLQTSAVACARRGLVMNALTMPVLDNPDLSPTLRKFLTRKISNLTSIIRGDYRSTSQSLRAVHESLAAGNIWIILADVWQPDFGRLRKHRFLGGTIQIPTGIERLAKATGVPMLHAATYTESSDRLRVVVRALPEEPVEAINEVIRQLETDVRERPWAWWQWGVWEQMWQKSTTEEAV